MYQLNQFLSVMRARGLPLKYVYDIGACSGQWTAAIKQGSLTDSEFWLFEANDNYTEILNERGFPFYTSVLSNPGRKYVDFYKKTNTGDSYYKETTTHFDNEVPTRLPCITLDELIERENIPVADFVKMDTQGSELDILAGANKVVGKASMFYVECPIIKYNAGAPNISQYLEYFADHNYVPIDIFEIHKAEDVLIQIDILFMKKDVKDILVSPTKTLRF